jgi:hypothetical protein
MSYSTKYLCRGQRGEKTESGEFQQFLVTELTRMEQNIMDFATQHEVFCSGNVFSHLEWSLSPWRNYRRGGLKVVGEFFEAISQL